MGYQKLTLISLRYPKTIILVWVIVLAFFGFYAPELPAALKDHGLFPDGAYGKVQQILSTDFHIPEDPVILVFEKKQAVSDERLLQFIRQTMLRLSTMDGLVEAVSPLENKEMLNGNYAYAILGFQQKSYERKPVLETLKRLLPDQNDISVTMTGKSVVQEDVNRASQIDLKKAEFIGIPIAFFIMWMAFGGFVSALLPIVIGVTGVTITMGIMYRLDGTVELSNFVLNVIPMVGLALSIDFALMVVSRFREELERAEAERALLVTLKTAGRAVLLSAACVFLGLAGILGIPLPMFTSVALGAMTVLLVSVLLTLTLLPALLLLLGPVIQSEGKTKITDNQSNLWFSMSHYVMKRPIRMALLAVMLIIVCLLPLKSIKITIPDASSLPHDYESRAAAELYQTHFVTPLTSQVYAVIQGEAHELEKEDWLNAYWFTRKLMNDPGVQQVESVFSQLHMKPESLYTMYRQPELLKNYEPVLKRFVKDNRMLIYVTLKGTPDSKQVMDWLRKWEKQEVTVNYWLGGEAKYQQEVFDAIYPNTLKVLLFIVLSNFAVLCIAFRSVLIPLKTILMNFLSLGASFGILVWIFQQGHFGMEPGSIAVMIPVFIFGLVFGISMDYGVFLVSRIYEIYRKTHNNDLAVLSGLTSTGKIITSAAAIMIAVTLPFAFGDVAGVKQLGIGIAAAILIDATIIRMILVPSLMRMLGRWNWWAP